MIDRFLKLDVKLLTARSFCHHVAGLAPIGIGTAAGASLLRITTVIFIEPGGRLQKLEMCQRGLSRKRDDGNDKKETNRISHREPPMLPQKCRHYNKLFDALKGVTQRRKDTEKERLKNFFSVSLCLCGDTPYDYVYEIWTVLTSPRNSCVC